MTGPKREYKKVEIVKRKELISLVFHKGMKIKEASQLLDIKYAVAKTIIVMYRKQKIICQQQIQTKSRCGFKVQKNQRSVHQLIAQLAGDVTSIRQY